MGYDPVSGMYTPDKPTTGAFSEIYMPKPSVQVPQTSMSYQGGAYTESKPVGTPFGQAGSTPTPTTVGGEYSSVVSEQRKELDDE